MRQVQAQQPQQWNMVQVAGTPGTPGYNSSSAGPASAGLAESAYNPMIQASLNQQSIDMYKYQSQQQHALNYDFLNQPNSGTATGKYDGKYNHMSDSDYYKKLASIESGGSGDYSALNKGSGAYGMYQFIPSTLKGMAKSMNKSEGYLRTPQGQEEMVRSFTSANERGLRNAGIEVNNFTRYMAHQQGLGGAIQLLNKGVGNHKNMSFNMPKGMEVNANNFLNHWRSRFA